MSFKLQASRMETHLAMCNVKPLEELEAFLPQEEGNQ